MKQRIFYSIAQLLLLLFVGQSYAADNGRARQVVETLANYFRAMPSYTVHFTVDAADFRTEGSYAVEDDNFYMLIGRAEAFSDGKTKWEVDPQHREVVIDRVDTSSRNLLGNPTHAFDFINSEFRAELLSTQGNMQRLRLTPTQKESTLSVITIEVEAGGKPRTLSYDADGDTLTIRIDRIEPQAQLKRFAKNAYPGYEIIDFR